MEFESLFAMLVIGALAGWLSGKIMEGRGFGLLGNIIVGIVGAFVAGRGRARLTPCRPRA